MKNKLYTKGIFKKRTIVDLCALALAVGFGVFSYTKFDWRYYKDSKKEVILQNISDFPTFTKEASLYFLNKAYLSVPKNFDKTKKKVITVDLYADEECERAYNELGANWQTEVSNIIDSLNDKLDEEYGLSLEIKTKNIWKSLDSEKDFHNIFRRFKRDVNRQNNLVIGFVGQDVDFVLKLNSGIHLHDVGYSQILGNHILIRVIPDKNLDGTNTISDYMRDEIKVTLLNEIASVFGFEEPPYHMTSVNIEKNNKLKIDEEAFNAIKKNKDRLWF